MFENKSLEWAFTLKFLVPKFPPQGIDNQIFKLP